MEATDAEPVVDGCAFYGRCSTEDNQDLETSRGWQMANARRFVEPLGGWSDVSPVHACGPRGRVVITNATMPSVVPPSI